MKIIKRSKQLFELYKHPQIFQQNIILSDGSIVEMTSLSSRKSTVKLTIDSISHPSWNPALIEKQVALNELGQMSKFANRFTTFDENEIFSTLPNASSFVGQKSYDNIPIIEDAKDESEPEWMKYRRAAEAKAAAEAEEKENEKAREKMNSKIKTKGKPVTPSTSTIATTSDNSSGSKISSFPKKKK